MHHTINSKHEKMKRNQIDWIDNAHSQELSELNEELKVVRPEIREWFKNNEEPIFLDVFVVNKVKTMKAEKEKKEEHDFRMSMCDQVGRRKERLAQLTDICKNYGMKDYVNDTIQLPEKELVRSFATGVTNAFAAYKKASNMQTAYVNCHFKEKRKTRAQRTMEKIKKEAHDNLSQGKTHKKWGNLPLTTQQWGPGSPDNKGNMSITDYTNLNDTSLF